MNLKPYPSYKPAGFQWLEKIPEHWEMMRLKMVAQLQPSNVDKKSKEGEEPVRLCNYVDVYKNEFIHPGLDFMKATAPKAQLKKFRIDEGDVIITKDSESWDDIAVPAYVESAEEDMVCGYHLTQIKPSEAMLGKFLFRCFGAEGIKSQFETAAVGVTRYALSKRGTDFAFFPVPDRKEQERIVEFLDRETGKIDELVTEQETMLGLLEEKRQAIITDAVTGRLQHEIGLPSPGTKPSGVEWLGDIPEHWKVKRLKFLAHFKSGDNITASELDDDNDYPAYGGNGLRGYAQNYTHDGKYILIGRQGAHCGNVHLVEGRFWASEHAVVASPTSDYDAYWLSEVLRTMNLNQYSISAAQPGLSVDQIKNLFAPLPDLKEQGVIADYLRNKTRQLDKLADEIESAIDLLKEHRTALVTAAVTGQIDVREV